MDCVEWCAHERRGLDRDCFDPISHIPSIWHTPGHLTQLALASASVANLASSCVTQSGRPAHHLYSSAECAVPVRWLGALGPVHSAKHVQRHILMHRITPTRARTCVDLTCASASMRWVAWPKSSWTALRSPCAAATDATTRRPAPGMRRRTPRRGLHPRPLRRRWPSHSH